MGKVYKNGIVSPKGFDMAAGEPVDQREIVESINDLTTLPHTYPGIEVKVVGEEYKEYKLIRTPSGLIENWIEVVPEYNQPAQQTTDTVLNNSDLPGETTTDALNSLAFGAVGTYAEIKAIRDGNRLTPGSRYTITDYQTKYFIEGSNSAGLKVINTLDSIFSSTWMIFAKGYDYLLEIGTQLTVKTLPDGYAGSVLVGDTALINDIFDNYYFKVDTTWEQDAGLIGATFEYALDRYVNIPNDTVVNDINGKPVIKPGGIINTEVHDGNDYMDQTGAENYPVPTEVIALIAATSNSFEPRGFSGTFLGDQVYYDMDDNQIINDNNEVIGTRNGRVFRRVSKNLQYDLAVDWRVQRYRRWLMDANSREKFTGNDTIENAGYPGNDNNSGNMIIGATYVIKGKYSNATRNTEAWVAVGAPDGEIGTVFVATATDGSPADNGAQGYAHRIFAAADILASEIYDISILGDTDFTLIGSNEIVPVTEVVDAGVTCKIDTVGDTDFTLIGSPDNVVGTIFVSNGTLPLGTGTVDIGNNVGKRFTATGPGVGTGYVQPPNLVRNSKSGWPLFGLYEVTTSELERFYIVRVPEEDFSALDRWGTMYSYKVGIEDIAMAKDICTIPITPSYEIDANYVGSNIVHNGEWSNSIINTVPGAVYNIDSVLKTTGIIRNCYFGSGISVGLGSSVSLQNLKSIDWITTSFGLHGTYIFNTQFVSPVLFSGSSAGAILDNVMVGGTTRGMLPDVSSYTWFAFAGLSSTQLFNTAIGNRTAYAALSNSRITNSTIFLGGREVQGQVNPDATIFRLSIDSGIIENTVVRFEGNMARSNFDRINTGASNGGNPRGDFVWLIQEDTSKTIFLLNSSNNSLLTKTYDSDNVESIVEVAKIDNR